LCVTSIAMATISESYVTDCQSGDVLSGIDFQASRVVITI